MRIWAALVLVAICALLWDAGIVLQKLAVDRMPRIRLGRGAASSLRSLLRSGLWMAGLAASALGWGIFAFALSFTPVSVARSLQGSGFVILAVLSALFLRHRLVAREWIGVALVTLGIAALGIANGSSPEVPLDLAAGRLAAALGICLLACAVVSAASGVLRIRIPRVITFSTIAGTLLGLGDVATKILIEILQRHAPAPAAAAAGACLIIFYVCGFLVLSRAYQHGRAILVTAVSDACSRLVAVFVGIAALGETLAGSPRLRLLAMLGYAGIILGAVLLARFSGEEIAARLAAHRPGSQVFGEPAKDEHAVPSEPDGKR